VKSLSEVLRLGKTIRVIGFDDMPFGKERGGPVNVSGIVCAGVKFEGMVYGTLTKDGTDATDVISELILGSKFHEQVHVVLLDGIAFGGFNVVDLPELYARVQRPCVAVMRKEPDFAAIERALEHFEDGVQRRRLMTLAGEVWTRYAPHVFQVVGEEPGVVAQALDTLVYQGNVPEALRMAHLIGSAIKTGESSNRA